MIGKNQIKLVKQLEMKKHRQREGLFVAEGPKVVGDLLKCGLMPKTVYATEGWSGCDGTILVTDEELRKLSFLQHPQQVLAVFPIPHPATALPTTKKLYLALDGVQDPGNLGTIVRIADWFGIDTIFCSPDTADVWNPKVVQATMGSIARVGVLYTDLPSLLAEVALPVFGTLLDGDDIYRHELPAKGIIVMGNEGNGISAPVRELVTHRLLIPAFRQGDSAESLNVAIATAITCSEFRRRERS